jgi:hypothetical protein
LALQRNYKYIFLNGVPPDFLYEKLLRFFIFIKNPGKTISSKSSVFDDPDFIYIENNNDNIDFFELSDVNSVNILETLNIPVGRINKDSVKNHYEIT